MFSHVRTLVELVLSRGKKCLAQGRSKVSPVGLEPTTPQSQVKRQPVNLLYNGKC